MIKNIYQWLSAWFDPKSFGAGNGVSLSRRLMALLVVVVSATLAYDGIKRGISTAWSVAATGLGTTLAGIWSVSKLKRGGQDGPGNGNNP
jgi:hypothetical protein